MGGSADLSPSTLTRLGPASDAVDKTSHQPVENPFGDFGPDGTVVEEHGPRKMSWGGRNVHFGVRELAMGAPLEWSMGAVRHSLGRSTTAEDIDYVVESVEPIVRKLRAAMPVGAR